MSKIVRNDDGPIFYPLDFWKNPMRCYSFDMEFNEDGSPKYTCELPPSYTYTFEDEILGYIYIRYICKDFEKRKYGWRYEIFVPELNIMIIRPTYNDDYDPHFTMTHKDRLEYEPLDKSGTITKLYGVVMDINIIALKPRFLELVKKHNETSLDEMEMNELCNIQELFPYKSEYPRWKDLPTH